MKPRQLFGKFLNVAQNDNGIVLKYLDFFLSSVNYLIVPFL